MLLRRKKSEKKIYICEVCFTCHIETGLTVHCMLNTKMKYYKNIVLAYLACVCVFFYFFVFSWHKDQTFCGGCRLDFSVD